LERAQSQEAVEFHLPEDGEIKNYDEIQDYDRSLTDKQSQIADILQVIQIHYIFDLFM
jgi:hypothetical protein